MSVDPSLEAEVLRLYEAGTAGISEGDYEYRVVSVSASGLRQLTGWTPASAKRWLRDEIQMAGGMGDHWKGILEGEIEAELPPVMVVGEDGHETVDGMHRLAGCVLHGYEPVDLVLGTKPGMEPGEAMEVEDGWDFGGEGAPSP